MKKYLPYFLILPSLIVGIFIGRFTAEKSPTPPTSQNPPNVSTVKSIEDGDSFTLNDGSKVRMNGINTQERGQNGYKEALDYLDKLIANKRVYLEYDRPPKDQYDRLLAWVWIDCESDTPNFLPADYMHKSQNESMPGLVDNPHGCKNGKLINEELVKNGFAKVEVYKDRGKLKYEDRIKIILSKSSS